MLSLVFVYLFSIVEFYSRSAITSSIARYLCIYLCISFLFTSLRDITKQLLSITVRELGVGYPVSHVHNPFFFLYAIQSSNRKWNKPFSTYFYFFLKGRGEKKEFNRLENNEVYILNRTDKIDANRFII